MTGLPDVDRADINRARALATARGVDAFRVVTGLQDEADDAMVYASALGSAQFLLGVLADLAERLGGGEDQAAGDTRHLNQIRDLLTDFDWEHDDRQYALEAIERIVTEGGNTDGS
jgi:hypothetical protein